MLSRIWDAFHLLRERKLSRRAKTPVWATEDTEEVELLRQVERRIDAATGWNSSTVVVAQVLRRLRGDHRAS
jgi:hypothetical protein